MESKICKNCRKIFRRYKSNLKQSKRYFCSRKCANQGKFNPKWKRGWSIDAYGYKRIYNPDHPFANSNRVKEHRIIMENFLGRLLNKDEIVHHKDENKLNNNIENLIILTRSEHMKLHNNLGK